jgi:hypothetical protein
MTENAEWLIRPAKIPEIGTAIGATGREEIFVIGAVRC